jgi:antitoxin component YwqK of YwqJK toxin-antitoxin module
MKYADKMKKRVPVRVLRLYHKNGQLRSEFLIINNKREGVYKEYHDNGQLNIICNCVNGKKGQYKQYFENGQLYMICNYVDDEYCGEFKEYSEDGQLIEIYKLVNGEINRIYANFAY